MLGGIFILGIGGFVIYKLVQGKTTEETSSNQKPAGNNDKPGQISPPQTDLPTPSKEEELEKYLLEKRLDLKKYFVFSLEELRTRNEARTDALNVRLIHSLFSEHLMKIASSYLEKTGEKII